MDDAANVAVLDRHGKVVSGGSKRGAVTAGKGRHGGAKDGGVGWRKAEGVSWKSLWNEGTDAVMDVPIGGVCEILYGDTM